MGTEMSKKIKPIPVVVLGPSLELKGGISAVEALMLCHQPIDIELLHIPSVQAGNKVYKICSFLIAIWKLGFLLLCDRSIQIVHLHFASRGSIFRKTILGYLALLMRKSLVLHAHGGGFEQFFMHLPRFPRYFLRDFFQRSACVLVLSNSWRAYYMDNFRLPSERVVVLPNPVVLPERIPCRTDRQSTTFVYLGRIEEAKGAFDAIDAFRHISSHLSSKAKLVLAGDGETAHAQRLVEELGLTENVTVHEWLNRSECERLLREADVFLLPSHQEGLPMALLEAMAWGLPVIATSVGGIPEVVTNRLEGVLVPPKHLRQLVEAMEHLIMNETVRYEMGIAARDRVAAFDICRFREKLHDVYFSLHHVEQGGVAIYANSAHSDR